MAKPSQEKLHQCSPTIACKNRVRQEDELPACTDVGLEVTDGGEAGKPSESIRNNRSQVHLPVCRGVPLSAPGDAEMVSSQPQHTGPGLTLGPRCSFECHGLAAHVLARLAGGGAYRYWREGLGFPQAPLERSAASVPASGTSGMRNSGSQVPPASWAPPV